MKPLALIILSLTLLTSCFSPQVYDISCAPSELPECPVVSQPIRVALVLGGGGAKGLAHVGAIEELVKANIPIDLVVGCSAGSIVGALYCDNPCTESLKEMLLTLKPNLLIDFDIWNARYGLCQGKSLRRFLYRNLRSKTFEELKKPFYLVATDLYSSELVTIGGGPLVPAIEASSSIPFVFVPVYLHGRAFVDGGVIDPIPVRVAKEFDAEVIIAVDLRGMLPKTFPRNLFGVAKRSAEITLLWQSEICLSQADVVVRPELCGIGTFENDQNERIYEAGRTAVKEMLPQILNILKERGIEIEPSSCP